MLRDPDASGTAVLSIMPLRAGSGDDGGGASMSSGNAVEEAEAKASRAVSEPF